MIYDKNDVISLIKDEAQKAGSVRELADILGLSRSHLSHTTHGRKKISPVILAYLGLEEVVTYRPVRKDYSCPETM